MEDWGLLLPHAAYVKNLPLFSMTHKGITKAHESKNMGRKCQTLLHTHCALAFQCTVTQVWSSLSCSAVVQQDQACDGSLVLQGVRSDLLGCPKQSLNII